MTYGVARALFAPGAPHWRLVDPGDPLAGQLTRLAVAVVATMAGSRLIEQIEETVQAGLSVAIRYARTRRLAVRRPRGRDAAELSARPAGEANAGRDWLSR